MSESPVTESSMTQTEYVAEKIVASRINEQGKKEYYIKWVGYDDKTNTWTPEDDIDCPDLILDFEMEKTALEDQENKKKASTTDEATPAKSKKEEKKVGLDRGLSPERIIDAKNVSGQLTFLIQWKDTKEADLVPASQANARCSQMVIRFYEGRLTWKSSSSEDEAL